MASRIRRIGFTTIAACGAGALAAWTLHKNDSNDRVSIYVNYSGMII